MKNFVLLSLAFLSAAHAQPARDTFLRSLDKLAREREQIRPEDIYSQARSAFERSPDEIRRKVDAWLDSLPPAGKAEGYVVVSEFGKIITPEEASTTLKERPSSARLFMQGFSPEDVVWLVLSQVDSLGLRKEKQSYQIARAYLRPRVELISRGASEVRLAVYDFDSLIEVTTVRANVGVLCPAILRVLKKKPNKAPEPTPGSVTPRAIERASK